MLAGIATKASLPHSIESPVRLADVIAALSFALDLTEGQPLGHSVRTCVIGMRLAKEIGLSADQLAGLYYALMMKDAGCSSNASRLFHIIGSDEIRAKRNVKNTDWTRTSFESLNYALKHVRPHAPFLERVRGLIFVALNQKVHSRELVQIRCERGAAIAKDIGLSAASAEAIYNLDEHWDGAGHPNGLRGEEIPLLARILNLAQTLEGFHAVAGPRAAVDVARMRGGSWFDPELVKVLISTASKGGLWDGLELANELVVDLEPEDNPRQVDEEGFDRICKAFADVIDAKSPFTYRHSERVARLAAATARELGRGVEEVDLVRRASLLHDIGKLGIPNQLLEKPDSLSTEEWDDVRRHPYFTFQILRRVPNAAAIAEIGVAHHERLDGSGYFRGLTGEDIPLATRIVAVANTFDSRSTRRSYHDACPTEKVLAAMRQETPHRLDSACVEAVTRVVQEEAWMED